MVNFKSKKEMGLRNPIEKDTDYSRTYEASPTFPFTNGTLASGKTEVFDIHRRTTASQKYGVFSNLIVSNTSTLNIWLYPNENTSRGIFIPSGTTFDFDRNALGGGFTSFSINNAGAGSLTANLIRLTAYKEGVVVNDIIKRATKLFVKSLGIGMSGGR